LFFIYCIPRDLLLVDHLHHFGILVRLELRLCHLHLGDSPVKVGGCFDCGCLHDDLGVVTRTGCHLPHLLRVLLLQLLHNLGSSHLL
jgi:hypothetical protein